MNKRNTMYMDVFTLYTLMLLLHSI